MEEKGRRGREVELERRDEELVSVRFLESARSSSASVGLRTLALDEK